ncbi:Uncharacterized protein OBRU01_07661 [Operophtera brumata]|uniref:CDT1 Geminin-binding domain-containing protein n=1 Tax=Operophtera brumata TaxID=104452 RepID=A0A0L7LIF2_OPEBR|nr:Uncharacterized protein OBRU01_07661 [Operophtera brumata]
MSQTTLTSYFNSRKRPAIDAKASSKNKIPRIERTQEGNVFNKCELDNKDVKPNIEVSKEINVVSAIKTENVSVPSNVAQKASASEPKLQEKAVFAKKLNASNIAKTGEPFRTTTDSARKDLSLGDIRKRLAGSSKLAELIASADRVSKGIRQVKETTEKRNLKEFKSIDVEVPLSPSKKPRVQNIFLSPTKQAPTPRRPLISPRKVIVSPVKSPNKISAYIRHATLATSTSLPLPHHYRLLVELFHDMETVVALLHNRNEKITFTKLKPSVQQLSKHTFNEKLLSQIKHLVPDFYNFQVQKIKNFCASSHKEEYELVITPNFPNNFKVMNPTVLLERRRFFNDTLLQLVKKQHAQYLLNLDPPMVIPDEKLCRWHPEFEIEKLPEVDSAKLPDMPNADKFSTAQDVLAKARELFKCNTKMERALEKLAQAKARGLTDDEKGATGINDQKPSDPNSLATQTCQSSTSSVTLLNPALRNLPTALLDKVRAKQAAKALEAMTRPAEHEQKYAIYSRLPDLARTLRNIFVTERKNVLALNIILSKLDSSFKANISASDLQRDIKVLIEEVPEWIKLHDIRNNTYLKLDKNTELKQISSKLEALAAKYKYD